MKFLVLGLSSIGLFGCVSNAKSIDGSENQSESIPESLYGQISHFLSGKKNFSVKVEALTSYGETKIESTTTNKFTGKCYSTTTSILQNSVPLEATQYDYYFFLKEDGHVKSYLEGNTEDGFDQYFDHKTYFNKDVIDDNGCLNLKLFEVEESEFEVTDNKLVFKDTTKFWNVFKLPSENFASTLTLADLNVSSAYATYDAKSSTIVAYVEYSYTYEDVAYSANSKMQFYDFDKTTITIPNVNLDMSTVGEWIYSHTKKVSVSGAEGNGYAKYEDGDKYFRAYENNIEGTTKFLYFYYESNMPELVACLDELVMEA